MPKHNSFFIVGCQRSGTTLLRLVLETHSSIQCFDETRSYSLLAGSPAADSNGKPVAGFKIPRWTEQLDAPLLWDFGLPDRALRFYSGQKILFVLRDVRDTISSMLKLRAGGKSWLDRWGLPILQAKAAQDKEFAARHRLELEAIRNAGHPSVAAAALYWKYKTAALLNYSEKYPVLAIHYEDLTAQPESQLRRICSFLNVPWEDGLLDHARIRHSEVFDTGLTVGDTDPKRPIDSKSVGQWRQFLTVEETAEIWGITEMAPAGLPAGCKGGVHPAATCRTDSATLG